MINVAIMGHGVVGSGVAEVLISHKESIDQKAKEDINVKRILDLRDFNDLPYSHLFTKDFECIVNDPDIQVVVEVMGGTNPAFDFVKRCLLAGKSVVTSNKELVAEKGCELLAIAQKNNVNFLFEASVGGGIPIIRPLAQCLSANNIVEILGILNGTTNYILTKMANEHTDYATVLAEAQRLGYAERNPSSDVDGIDTQRKICILASLAFGRHVYPRQVDAQGISEITGQDFEYARACDCNIKLIGHTKLQQNGKVWAQVYPALVKNNNILSNVDDVFNAILVRGDTVGDVMFYGRGAGKLPTASAVVADVIDCVKHISARKYLSWDEGSDDYVQSKCTDSVRLYVRADCDNYAETKQAACAMLPGAEIISLNNPAYGEIAFITPAGVEEELRSRIEKIHGIKNIHILHTVV